jgi:ferredoxin
VVVLHGKKVERQKDESWQEELEQALEECPYWGC